MFFLAKFGFDTAENEPREVCWNCGKYQIIARRLCGVCFKHSTRFPELFGKRGQGLIAISCNILEIRFAVLSERVGRWLYPAKPAKQPAEQHVHAAASDDLSFQRR